MRSTDDDPKDFFPRPERDLEYAEFMRTKIKNKSKQDDNKPKIEFIEQIQQLTGTKPLEHVATIDDYNNTDNSLQESIAMMRRFRLKDDGNEALLPEQNKNNAETDEVYYMRNGSTVLPVLLGAKFFKLQSDTDTTCIESMDKDKLNESITNEESKEQSSNKNTNFDNAKENRTYCSIPKQNFNIEYIKQETALQNLRPNNGSFNSVELEDESPFESSFDSELFYTTSENTFSEENAILSDSFEVYGTCKVRRKPKNYAQPVAKKRNKRLSQNDRRNVTPLLENRGTFQYDY